MSRIQILKLVAIMKVSGNYSDLWKAIIRPPRDQYELQNLGKCTCLLNEYCCRSQLLQAGEEVV